MIGRIIGIICILSMVFGIVSGNMETIGNCILDSAKNAVELTLSLTGIMCLWSGIMQVLSDAGAIKKLSRIMSPLLRVVFPTAFGTGTGAEEISANVSANLLGIGNAATPLAIRAMKKMQSINPHPDTASADMITLAVLNTASVSIMPSTVVAMRRAAGACEPFAVVIPVWICSFCGAIVAVVLCRLCAKTVKKY